MGGDGGDIIFPTEGPTTVPTEGPTTVSTTETGAKYMTGQDPSMDTFGSERYDQNSCLLCRHSISHQLL